MVIEFTYYKSTDGGRGEPKKITIARELPDGSLRFSHGNIYYYENGKEKFQAAYLFHRSPQVNMKQETTINEPDLSHDFVDLLELKKALPEEFQPHVERPTTMKIKLFKKDK